jgi:hypothetical protein
MRPRRRNLAGALLGALFACLACAGCGYGFASSGTNLPSDAKTIYIPRFANLSRETGVNDIFMRYLDDEVASHDRLRIVDSAADADLELSGEIVTFTPLPTSFNSVLEPTIYNENMTVRASLKDLHKHKIIWSGSGFSYTEHAPVVAQAVVPSTPEFVQGNLRSSDIANMTDMQVAQTQIASAQDLMMKFIAKNLYASMAEGF